MANLILALIGLGLGVFGTSESVPPIRRALEYQTNYITPNRFPDPDQLITLAITQKIPIQAYTEYMRCHGYDYNHSLMLLNAILSTPTVEESVQLFLRGELTEADLDLALYRNGIGLERIAGIKKLIWRVIDLDTAIKLYYRGRIDLDTLEKIARHHGYRENQLSLLLEGYLHYPSPDDVVTFAVREVYNPEIRQKYGLDEDLSPKYLEMARKAGLSEEFARDYWASHWQLPSVEMGFEMFHRGIITHEELLTLLRTHDIMPFWRDKLVQLSYSLVTRVDARRMLELGVWTPQRFYRHMLALGYSPEDARDITEWAVEEYVQANKELTKSDIKKALFSHSIDIQTAHDMLLDLGYSELNAQIILNEWLREMLKNWVDKQIEYYKYMYVRGRISLSDLRNQLSQLDITPERLEHEVLDAVLEKEKRVKLPSKDDILTWYKNNQISYETARNMLLDLGYDHFVTFLLLGGKEEEYPGEVK